MQVDVGFMYKPQCSNIRIKEIINLEAECKKINYYCIGDNKNHICINGEIVFCIEYIPIGLQEVRYMEIIKRISSITHIKNSIEDRKKLIKKVVIQSKEVRLIEEYSIFINADVNIIIDA